MRTISCKKCGMVIDAALGECPNCGAVYYILPDQDAGASTQRNEPAQKNLDIGSASNDDIFRTGVWKNERDNERDVDETRAFQPAAQQTERRTTIRPASRQPEASPQRRDKRRSEPAAKKKPNAARNRLIVAAMGLLAVLTLVISIMSGAFDFNKGGDRPTMPNVLNHQIETATNVLESMGLVVIPEYEFNIAPEGTVIAQSIKENRIVKEGDKVTLTVSKGPDESAEETIEEVTVPNLLGKSYDQAVHDLGLLGLLVQTGEPQYSDEPEGRVISQNPNQGSIVRKGDMVLIILSKGPEPSPSPPSFAITVTAGTGGSVSPRGLVTVAEGEDITFTITPNEGYEIREVKVDSVDVGPVDSYTFTDVTEDHSLYVVFKVKIDLTTPTPTPTLPPSQIPMPPETGAPVG